MCVTVWVLRYKNKKNGDRGTIVFTATLRETTFFLEEFIIGTQTDSRTSTLFASLKTVCPQMSRKPENMELANEENKKFDPDGKEREPPL